MRAHHRLGALVSLVLLAFFILHLLTSSALFVLSLLSIETNASASHALRHIVNNANLSAVIFVDPTTGHTGDWRKAPAQVIDSSTLNFTDSSVICNDEGKKCKSVYPKGKKPKSISASTSIISVTPSTTSSVIPDTTLPPNIDPLTSATSTSTSVLVISGTVLTTELLVVPTVTVLKGQVITTEVLLPASASLPKTSAFPTLALSSSTQTSTVGLITAPTTTAPQLVSTTVTSSVQVIDQNSKGSTHLGISNDHVDDNENEHGDEDESEDNDSNDERHEDGAKDQRNVHSASLLRRDIAISIVEAKGSVVGVAISGLSDTKTSFISQECAVSFGWPINSLDNLVREEIVLASLFLWILGLAIMALLNESTPHLIALLASLLCIIIWTAYDLSLSFAFSHMFEKDIVERSCAGVNVLPNHLTKRIGFQSTVLAISLGTLFASSVLCWRMRDHFGWQTFRRIGASIKINRIYKLVLGLSILLQLDVFVLVTFFALFLDQISRGQTSYYMANCRAFQVVYSILIFLLIPWAYLGWTSVRNERRTWFNLFVGLCILLIAGWAVLFANEIFRVIFTTWAFFTALGSLGLVLIVLSVVLAIIRRATFGRGLAEYLYVEEIQERPSAGFEEKISTLPRPPDGSLPTFSVALGASLTPSPPRRMFERLRRPATVTAPRAPSWQPADDLRALR